MKTTPTLLSLFVASIFLTLTACDQANKQVDTPSLADPSKTTEAFTDSFDNKNTKWKSYVGDWKFEKGELLQTSTKNDFPVILNESQSISDVDVSVDFKPISGYIDASGGLIFRAEDEDNYYIVRALTAATYKIKATSYDDIFDKKLV
jgi:hypothetical protein